MYHDTRFAAGRAVKGPWYNPSVSSAWFAGIIAALAFLSVGYLVFSSASPLTPPLLSSTVMVSLEKGHGSGVHIGDGLILTAAHVAAGDAVVKIKTSDGAEREATVLWSSTKSDVALLLTSQQGLSASPLSCAPVVVGSQVHAEGSPLDIGQITTYGHIVSGPHAAGDWQSVVTVDMTILPGMSGGPVFNSYDEVVGLSVGVATAPAGFGISLTGVGMIVPSTVICGLLGRH